MISKALCLLASTFFLTMTFWSLEGISCYQLLKITPEKYYESYDRSVLVTNEQHVNFFREMRQKCQKKCKEKSIECIGIYIADLKSIDDIATPLGILTMIGVSEPPYGSNIKNPVKEPDCLCIKASDPSPEFEKEYISWEDSINSYHSLFEIIQSNKNFERWVFKDLKSRYGGGSQVDHSNQWVVPSHHLIKIWLYEQKHILALGYELPSW